MSTPSLLAIAAHPDDIEILFAGAMIHLADRGWDIHYMNLCDGSRGSTVMDETECAATRLKESKQACEVLRATFHDPIYPDMESAYTTEHLKRVLAVIRRTKPRIVLTHSPSDYMEDHEIACRLAVSAAFASNMPNLESDPPVAAFMEPITVYHAQPIGNRVPTGQWVTPHYYLDVTGIVETKVTALACHVSQKRWLDESQGMDSYLETLRQSNRDLGERSQKYQYAEGWRRREHWGFCGPDDDPLKEALSDLIYDVRNREELYREPA